jgi:hypothetical protein
LIGQGAALDHDRRFVGGATGRDQALGDPRQSLHSHVEDEGAGERRKGVVVERGFLLLGVFVPGDEGNGRGVVAVGHRDARVGGGRDAGGDPGNDLEGDAGGGKRLGLLPAPPEDEGIAPLEADHDLSLPSTIDQELLDSLLRDARRAGILADVEHFDSGPGEIQRLFGNQAVADDHVGGDDQLQRPGGHQPRVPRASADQVDDPAH